MKKSQALDYANNMRQIVQRARSYYPETIQAKLGLQPMPEDWLVGDNSVALLEMLSGDLQNMVPLDFLNLMVIANLHNFNVLARIMGFPDFPPLDPTWTGGWEAE